MGIAREVGSTSEYTIYAQSAEDYLNSHAAFDSDVEFSLNLFMRTEYGIDLAGKMNDSIEGELFGPEELIYTYDSETGRYVALGKALLNSNFFMDTLQKGTPYFIPSLDKDRNLDFTNPKIIKVSQYKGENQLFIMGDRQLRHAEDELKHVEKPTFWQRFADGFLKIFGSRNAACENYEKFQAMMGQTLKLMQNDHEKVKAFELERQEQERQERERLEEEAREFEERRKIEQELEQQGEKELTFGDFEEPEAFEDEIQENLATEKIVWPEYERRSKSLIKRNMSAEEFEQLLKLMVEEGGKSLVTIVDDHQCKINHEALVAVMLCFPARDFLKNADAAKDREKFLLENREAFLLQINDFEKQVREIDLSLVDELFSRDIYSRYEPGVTVGQKLIMTLEDLDVKVRNIYMDHLDKIREEQAEQERLHQEEQRKIEEATRRRDEVLKRNPYSSRDIKDYMSEPEPLEEVSLGLKRSIALQDTNDFLQDTNDFPQETNDFPQETNDFPQETSDFPQETNDFPQETNDFPQETNDFPQGTNDFPASNRNSWGNFGDNGNDFGSVNNNPFGNAPQTTQNSQPKYNPFDNPLVNPFDDAPQTTQNAPQLSNPFDSPFGDAPQTTQNAPQNSNPFDNPFGDAPQTSQNAPQISNPFDSPFGAPFGDAPQTTQYAPQLSNPFDSPFGDAPQTTQNAPQISNPFDNPPQPEPVKQSGPVRGL